MGILCTHSNLPIQGNMRGVQLYVLVESKGKEGMSNCSSAASWAKNSSAPARGFSVLMGPPRPAVPVVLGYWQKHGVIFLGLDIIIRKDLG